MVQSQDIEAGLTETVSLLDKLRMAIYRMEFAPGTPAAARISQNPTACAVSGGRCRSTAA